VLGKGGFAFLQVAFKREATGKRKKLLFHGEEKRRQEYRHVCLPMQPVAGKSGSMGEKKVTSERGPIRKSGRKRRPTM